MFPVNDINFVVCGFATVAATMGYACSRRYAHNPTSPTLGALPGGGLDSGDRPDDKTQIASTSNEKVIDQPEPLLQESEAIVPSTVLSRRSSLKRKRPNDDDEDYSNAGYPLNLLSIYPPAKRSRTPPSEIDGLNDTNISAAAAPETPARTDVQEAPKVESPQPVEELPSLTASPRSESSDEGSEGPTTPPDVPLVLPPSPKKSSLEVASPSPPATPPPPKRAATFAGPFSNGGFAVFAGNGSPFSSQSFCSPSPSRGIKPAWCTPSGSSKSIFDAPNEPSSNTSGVEEVAIAPAEVRSDSPQTHITGEEDEEPALELKNIKLFVKRGKKNFSNGMIGSIKLLANKSTNSERLLFRREPLWKVSMNVRVNTSLRCTFDAEEHVLRIVLAETVESPDIPAAQWPREIVVYALKPGRSSKTDFTTFAEALIARPSLASAPSQ
ncbi:RanBD1 domain-containing protein [Pleurotus pulmonarius]